MNSGKSWLIPVAIEFVFVSIWCTVEVYRNRNLFKNSGDFSSAGWETRRIFHTLLGAANFARAMSVVVEMTMDGETVDDCSGFACWVIGFMHWFPQLIFFMTFSLLTLFWAQLYYATWGISYATLRPGFVAVNVALFSCFIILAVVSAAKGDYSNIFLQPFYMMAVAYFIGCCAMMYFGINVIIQLRPRSKFSQSYPARKMVLTRLVILCSLCTTVNLVQMIYCFIAIGSLSESSLPGYPKRDDMDRHYFEALEYTLLECIPSIVILLLTRKMSQVSVGSETSSAANNHVIMTADDDEAYYQPLQMTPPTRTSGLGESLATQMLRSDHELEQQSRNFTL